MRNLARIVGAMTLALSVTLAAQGAASAAAPDPVDPSFWRNVPGTGAITTDTLVDASALEGKVVTDAAIKSVPVLGNIAMAAAVGYGTYQTIKSLMTQVQTHGDAQASTGQAEAALRAGGWTGSTSCYNPGSIKNSFLGFTTFGIYEMPGIGRIEIGNVHYASGGGGGVASCLIAYVVSGFTLSGAGSQVEPYYGYIMGINFTGPGYGSTSLDASWGSSGYVGQNNTWTKTVATGEMLPLGVGNSMPGPNACWSGTATPAGGCAITGWSLESGWSPQEASGGCANPNQTHGGVLAMASACKFSEVFTPNVVRSADNVITETIVCDPPLGSTGLNQKSMTATLTATSKTLTCAQIGDGWFPRDVKITVGNKTSEVTFPAATGTQQAVVPGVGRQYVTGVQPGAGTAPSTVSSTATDPAPDNAPDQTVTGSGPSPNTSCGLGCQLVDVSCYHPTWSANPLNWAFDAFKNAGMVLFIPCNMDQVDFTGSHPQMDKWSLPTPDNLWPGEGCGGVTITMPHKYFNDWSTTLLNTCNAPYTTIKNWLYPIALLAVLLAGTAAAWERLTKGLGIVLYDVSKNSGQMGLW